MKRILVVLFLLTVVGTTRSFACDACACSSTGLGSGMLNAFGNNNVRLQFGRTSFQTTTVAGKEIKDRFNQFAVNVRYHFYKRFKVIATLPYMLNQRIEPEVTREIRGLGDARFMLGYTVLSEASVLSGKTFLEVLFGAQLPTGEFDSRIHERQIPENFNPGRGRVGYLTMINIAQKYENKGLVLNGGYLHFQPDHNAYQFGNQFSTQLSAYLKKVINEKVSITPFTGIYAEYVQSDYYVTGLDVQETGGQGMFAVGGLNITYESWLLGVQNSWTIWERYGSGAMHNNLRLTAQLAYIY